MELNFDFTPTKKLAYTINLPLERVVNAALKNWDRLGCNNNKSSCKYFYNDEKDTRCVIGIAFEKDEFDKIKMYNTNTNVWTLDKEKVINTDNLDSLHYLQKLHDDACLATDATTASKNREKLKKNLEDLQKNFNKNIINTEKST